VRCFHCGSSKLRLSRLRSNDFAGLLQLQVPLRCRFCHERFYRSLFRAWRAGILAKAAHKRHHQNRNIGGGSAAA
jgi:hypothetical protein